jgi:hypothetical protein
LFLVVEVPETAGEVEPAVDATVDDLPARCRYSLSLGLVLGFVVVGKRDCVALAAEYGSGVAGIGCEYFGRGDEHDAGRAARAQGDGAVIEAGGVRFLSDDLQLLLSLLALDYLVDLLEGFDQGFGVFFLFVQLAPFELRHEDPFDKFRDLKSWVEGGVPPWPSKTPKRELPLPMSSSEIAASSMVRLQPG